MLGLSYLGFLTATVLGSSWAGPAIAAVSVVCTIGEIIYAGNATTFVMALVPARLLGRAVARFELSTGVGLAVSPAVLTTLAPLGPGALWGGLAGAALLYAGAVAEVGEPGLN
ncbi:hypothetical protein [Amycolatopsis circi]|uniref:hypothetical protein n=1 Tax=Amycolatopsis circi TaxID=871959 RepID=UPI001ABF1485|nr:hypothetical protein [Amycolatopsis circi]